jgi:hypothetical protein
MAEIAEAVLVAGRNACYYQQKIMEYYYQEKIMKYFHDQHCIMESYCQQNKLNIIISRTYRTIIIST